MVKQQETAGCDLLLVAFSPASALPFAWLGMSMPGLRMAKTSLVEAFSEADGHDYKMIFVEIPSQPTQLDWFLVGELVCRLQTRWPIPVVVPVVASGNVLHGMSRLLSEVAPVYLTRPVDLHDLQQVVHAFTPAPPEGLRKSPPRLQPRGHRHAAIATSSR